MISGVGLVLQAFVMTRLYFALSPLSPALPPPPSTLSTTQSNAQQPKASQELAAFVHQTIDRFIHKRKGALHQHEIRSQVTGITRAILLAGERYEIDPIVLTAVIQTESGFNPNAIGRSGEIGLMQIKPTTASWILATGEMKRSGLILNEKTLAQTLRDPLTNAMFGAAYLAYTKRLFPKHRSLYLAAYNMGVGGLQNLLNQGIQPRRYTDRVLATHASLKRALAEHRHHTQTTASTFGLHQESR